MQIPATLTSSLGWLKQSYHVKQSQHMCIETAPFMNKYVQDMAGYYANVYFKSQYLQPK